MSYFFVLNILGADINFYNLAVNLTYIETMGDSVSPVENQKQLFPSRDLSRNVAAGLKASSTSNTVIYNLGIQSSDDSCDSYVRFYLEVYLTHTFSNGITCYIDSNGN